MSLYPAPPRFSVVMPSRNSAAYLPTAIESVLGQTWTDFELVICDDGSTDHSAQILDTYRQDPRVRILDQPRGRGLARTLHDLFAAARGTIIAIVDGADALTSDALATVARAYREDPSRGAVYTQHLVCDEALRPLRVGFCRAIPAGESTLDDDRVSALRTFRRGLYFATDGLGRDTRLAEDKDLTFKLEEVSGPPHFVDQAVYLYRRRRGSRSRDRRSQLIGRNSAQLARFRAFQRRLTAPDVPNLTGPAMARWLLRSARWSLRGGRPVRAVLDVARAAHAVALRPPW